MDKMTYTATHKMEAMKVAKFALAEVNRLGLIAFIQPTESGSDYILMFDLPGKSESSDLAIFRAVCLAEMAIDPTASSMCYNCSRQGWRESCYRLPVNMTLVSNSCGNTKGD